MTKKNYKHVFCLWFGSPIKNLVTGEVGFIVRPTDDFQVERCNTYFCRFYNMQHFEKTGEWVLRTVSTSERVDLSDDNITRDVPELTKEIIRTTIAEYDLAEITDWDIKETIYKACHIVQDSERRWAFLREKEHITDDMIIAQLSDEFGIYTGHTTARGGHADYEGKQNPKLKITFWGKEMIFTARQLIPYVRDLLDLPEHKAQLTLF